MTTNSPRRNIGTDVPTTVWIPGPDERAAAPSAEPSSVLPNWAITRARISFAPPNPASPGMPGPMWHTVIPDLAAGMSTRSRCVLVGEAADGAPLPRTLLAELAPAAAVGTGRPDGPGQAWPGFLAHARRLIGPSGTLLVATAQRHRAGPFVDAGALIRSIRACGFAYRQHLVVVTARIDRDRFLPVPPTAAGYRHQLGHADLFAFTPQQSDLPEGECAR